MQGRGLSCNATNCSHNFCYKCKAGAIDVSGGSASCRTFEDRAGRSFVNSLNDYFTTETSNIKCEALNCVHNENKGCYADDVQIDFNNALNDEYFLLFGSLDITDILVSIYFQRFNIEL